MKSLNCSSLTSVAIFFWKYLNHSGWPRTATGLAPPDAATVLQESLPSFKCSYYHDKFSVMACWYQDLQCVDTYVYM